MAMRQKNDIVYMAGTNLVLLTMVFDSSRIVSRLLYAERLHHPVLHRLLLERLHHPVLHRLLLEKKKERLLFNANSAISQLYHGELDFYSASSLKQQSADRHVAPLGHIILIPSQPVFAISTECCVLSGEGSNKYQS
jgi:hypothetical protein